MKKDYAEAIISHAKPTAIGQMFGKSMNFRREKTPESSASDGACSCCGMASKATFTSPAATKPRYRSVILVKLLAAFESVRSQPSQSSAPSLTDGSFRDIWMSV